MRRRRGRAESVRVCISHGEWQGKRVGMVEVAKQQKVCRIEVRVEKGEAEDTQIPCLAVCSTKGELLWDPCAQARKI